MYVSRNALTHLLLIGVTWLSAVVARGGDASPVVTNAPRARVVSVQDPEALDSFRPRADHVRAMVTQGLTNLTGKPTVKEAWLSLVKTQDVIGLKVFSLPGANSGTRPAVVEAVIQGLMLAGVPAHNIIIWDRRLIDLQLAGYMDLVEHYGVRLEASVHAGFDEKAFYDRPLLGQPLYGDLEFGKTGPGVGRKSFVTKVLTKEVTRIIQIAPLLNHNIAGVSGCLYGLSMGSVDNILRFENDPRVLAEAVPDVYNLPQIGDRVAINIVDALISQYEGGDSGLLHYATTPNELRFSFDPVALDALSINDLESQRRAAGAPPIDANHDLYDNAALLGLGESDLKKIRVVRLTPQTSLSLK